MAICYLSSIHATTVAPASASINTTRLSTTATSAAPISSSLRPLPLLPKVSLNTRLVSCVNNGWIHCLSIRASVTTEKGKSPAEEDWKVKREYLLKNQVRSVSVKEAYRLQQQDNYVILDVRPEADFKEAYPAGAVNVQVYRLIKEWTAWDIARRAAFAFFGIFSGTEANPEFLNEVSSKVGKDKRIIVACASGGTMKPSASLADGQQSRSLIAAYLLKLDGYKIVLHMEGGIRNWFKEDLPVESSLDE